MKKLYMMLCIASVALGSCSENPRTTCVDSDECATRSGGECLEGACFYPTDQCESGWSLESGACSPFGSRDGGVEPPRDASTDVADSGVQADASVDAPVDPDAEASADANADTGPPPPLKAFPTAYGGGAAATGGRGGVLVIVNTDDPNVELTHFPATATTPERFEGGLFGALQLDRPAYIVFDRSMNIDIGRGGTSARFSYDGIPGVRDKTVFGQSAPRGGVTITGGTLRFDGRSSETSNLIIRYLRSRPIFNREGVRSTEDDSYTWGMLFYGGRDIIVDHCSFSFAQDKALGAYIDQNVVPEHDLRRMTFSRNFVNDSHTGTYVEINPGRPEDPEEDVDHISFIGNLQLGINRSPNVAFDGFSEILNTVVYGDHYKSSTIYHDLKLNHIGNYYVRPGGGSSGFNRVFEHDSSSPRIFSAGNYFSGLLEGRQGEDNQAIWKYRDTYDDAISGQYFVDTPFDGGIEHAYTPVSAAEAYASVVTQGDIGADRYLDDEGRPATYRDPYDTAQLEAVRAGDTLEVRNPANWVLPTLPETARPADYDTDRDGMADAWERRVFGDLTQSYADDADGDGYTNIEEFMFQVDFR